MSTKKRLIDLLIDYLEAEERGARLSWYCEHPGLDDRERTILSDVDSLLDSPEYQMGYADALRQCGDRMLANMRRYADLFDGG
jgi:hypothetical protein